MYPTNIRRRRELATPKRQPPVISSVAPPSFPTGGSTVIKGRNFGRFKAGGKVYFGEAAAYGDCATLVEQPTYLWADTSIGISNTIQGGLPDNCYAYVVTKDGRVNSSGASVSFMPL